MGGSFVNWEKNCKGQFCFKTNTFVNPSFLKISRKGDPTSNRSNPIRALTRTKSLYMLDRLHIG